MEYVTYCRLRPGDRAEWVWEHPTLAEARARVLELLENGYSEAWVEPASEAEALESMEAEVASLQARLAMRNRQIRDLRKELRKGS